MPHSYTSLNIHYVFGTEGRFQIDSAETRKRLHKYIESICMNLECKVLASYVMPDHVHLLLCIPAKLSVAELATKIKSNSSRFMNQADMFPCRFNWQSGYGAFSCSFSMIDTVTNYIQTQEEHHRHRAFDDEFEVLISKHTEQDSD